MNEPNGNAALYFIDRHAHSSYADNPAFVEADGQQRQLSYTALSHESAKMASLYEKHNIHREDRAALLLLDCIEFPIIFWGSLKAGVIPVPINTLLATDVYDSILRDSRASVLFVSAQLLPVITPALENNPYVKVVFVIGEHESPHLSFDEALSTGVAREPLQVIGDECAFWLYSSGSTGRPKGVRHVHSSLQVTSDTYGSQVLGIEHQDVIYSAAKFFFAYGLGNAMTFPLSVGATTLLLAGRPTPESVLDVINRLKPTIFCGVPTLYAATIAYIESGKGELNTRLRRCISAGEALPEQVGVNWESLSGTIILDGVGSTEMLHIYLSNSPGDTVFGTSGVAVPGYDIRLIDEHGEEVGTGEVGELLVNGGSAASDYWNQRDKSRNTFEGVWTRTGDKYERNAEGRLVYCGRTDDMFKVSGIWVSPFEIEQALASHPTVLEAAVVAMRDSDNLEKPKAFVVLKQDANTDDVVSLLKEHVKEKVGKWKYPREIVLVEDLPKTATGKIQRFKLRT